MRAIRALAASVEPLRVQHAVHRIGAGGRTVMRAPQRAKAPVVAVPALRARPVSRGERRRLVEKEELGPAARLHAEAPASAELQAAGDPAAHLPRPDDAPLDRLPPG